MAKVLEGYGVRVQKSVFECEDLSEERLLRLKSKLERYIDNGEDTVRYYRQCKGCLRGFELSGAGEEPRKGGAGVY